MRALAPRKAQLDHLAGAVVRARGYCQNPACKTPISGFNRLCWCHIIPRKHLSLRWLPENALCLCLMCESYFTAHPIEQQAFFIEMIGEEQYWALKYRSQKKEFIDYEEIGKKLREMLKNTQNSY